MIAWVLVGVLALVGSLILAEIAIIHPQAGGNYVFLREGYGRWAGFLWGWVEFWIIRSGSIAALATVFAESLHDVLRFFHGYETADGGFVMPTEVLNFWAVRGITVAVIIALALVNMPRHLARRRLAGRRHLGQGDLASYHRRPAVHLSRADIEHGGATRCASSQSGRRMSAASTGRNS